MWRRDCEEDVCWCMIMSLRGLEKGQFDMKGDWVLDLDRLRIARGVGCLF